MAERFQKLYSLPSNLYSTFSPVIVSAGSLLKDTETGKTIVQIKYQSVSSRKIKALKVDIAAFDITGAKLEGITGYQYLDLSVDNGDDFGANKAIILSDAVARSFQISRLTVVFSDGDIYDVRLPMSQLSSLHTLSEELKNDELVKQYQIAVNIYAKYVPQEHGDLWSCSCGKWNAGNQCTHCHATKKVVLSSFNKGWLSKCAYQRVEAARIAREKEEEQKLAEIEEIERENEKKKKTCKLVSIICAALIFLSAIGYFVGYPLISYWAGDYTVYINMYDVKNFKVPRGTTEIREREFYYYTSLKSITIPDSVTNIGDYAFGVCTSLSSITIPDSVTSIGDHAFWCCTSLTSIIIPDSVTSIGDSAFRGCTSLTSITIPDSVTSIGNYAFWNCSSLTNIIFTGTKAQWKAISKGNNWNYNTGSYTIHCTDGDISK